MSIKFLDVSTQRKTGNIPQTYRSGGQDMYGSCPDKCPLKPVDAKTASEVDEEYARALDTIVKACVDILLTNKDGEILLGKRIIKPFNNWWYIGGRMKPGESIEIAAQRHIKNDTSLNIEAKRLTFISSNTLIWDERLQKPSNNGTCDINTVMTVKLTDDEISNLKYCKNEYSEFKFWKREQILNSNFHQALKDSISSIIVNEKLDKLKDSVLQNKDDTYISKLAKDIFI